MRSFGSLAILVLVASALLPGSVSAQEAAEPRTLTVAGTGEAAARPDMAHIQAGVVTEAANAAEALAANSTAMGALQETLSAFGIAVRDVQTAAFNIYPVYTRDERGGEPPRIAAYRVENRVAIKVRELARLGELLDALVRQGANTVHDIRFGVAEEEPLMDQARREAVTDARRKAELYAEAAGVPLGQVLSLTEEMVGTPPPRPYAVRSMAAESSVPVAPGELTFEARIVAVYEIGGE